MGRIAVQGQLRHKFKTLPKILTKAKKTGDLAQVVEHHPNKCK
jgi:hypothetical protein